MGSTVPALQEFPAHSSSSPPIATVISHNPRASAREKEKYQELKRDITSNLNYKMKSRIIKKSTLLKTQSKVLGISSNTGKFA